MLNSEKLIIHSILQVQRSIECPVIVQVDYGCLVLIYGFVGEVLKFMSYRYIDKVT